MRLILFDIDGTLIHVHRAGRESMSRALQELFGTSGPIESYNFAGKTDRRIVTDLLRAARINLSGAELDRRLQQVYDGMASHGPDLFRGALHPCEGVAELLAALEARSSEVVLGLVTGNCEATAPLKLAAAGIRPELFRVGAYGSEHEDRDRLAFLALERAEELTGRDFNSTNAILIGDTPADIVSARAAGIPAVAVATGRYSAGTLTQYQPDYLFESLADTEAVLALMLGSATRATHGRNVR